MHTSLYNGHSGDFTECLANYFYFRDDARFGGWQAYLQRSDDFIRVPLLPARHGDVGGPRAPEKH